VKFQGVIGILKCQPRVPDTGKLLIASVPDTR